MSDLALSRDINLVEKSHMKQKVVIIGMGEMGGVFARGLLRAGYPVYPITRNMDLSAEASNITDPLLVLLAVGEGDLHTSLETVPPQWRERLVLLQNELLPRDWQNTGYQQPTVIVAAKRIIAA
jgi:hypothetical protein